MYFFNFHSASINQPTLSYKDLGAILKLFKISKEELSVHIQPGDLVFREDHFMQCSISVLFCPAVGANKTPGTTYNIEWLQASNIVLGDGGNLYSHPPLLRGM